MYNPTFLTLLETSALATALPNSLTVSYGSGATVNGATTLEFTLNPSVNINDYIVLKMPPVMFNKNYNLYSPACSFASKVEIFYYSGVVRLWLTGPHSAGNSKTYIITDFPTSQY